MSTVYSGDTRNPRLHNRYMAKTYAQHVMQLVKAQRERRKLSLEAVGERFKVTRQQVANWEKASPLPPGDRLFEVLDFFEIPYFIGPEPIDDIVTDAAQIYFSGLPESSRPPRPYAESLIEMAKKDAYERLRALREAALADPPESATSPKKA